MKLILMKMILPICMFALLTLSPAYAGGEFGNSDIDTEKPVSEILVQQRSIREDIQASRNGWGDFSQTRRSEVLAKQSRVFALLQGKQRIADLSSKDQIEVANLLESIKGIANNAEDGRKICTRERKMGSNFSTRVCRTVAESRRLRELSKDAIQKRPLPPRSGSN